MTGKHRKPHRSTGRNLAATAAVLTAGALPLATAGSAFADSADTGSPLSSVLVGSLQQPVRQAVPLAGTVAEDVTSSVRSGDLPVGGLLGGGTPLAQTRSADLDRQASLQSADLAAETAGLAGQTGAALPVAGMLGELAPSAPGQPMRVAPAVLRNGVVGTFADELSAQGTVISARVVNQMHPTVQQLHTAGVPTVEDMTSTLSTAQMPVFGTVGGFTSAIPVDETLGGGSPVIGAVGMASSL